VTHGSGGRHVGAISSGCFTTIVAPDSTVLTEPIRSGEGAHFMEETAMNRTNVLISGIAIVWLVVLGGLAISAQDSARANTR
jgi:hypothetical protein